MRKMLLVSACMIVGVCGCVTQPKWTPLHDAAIAGDLDAVEKSLASGENIDRPGYLPEKPQHVLDTLKTPLGIAIEQDNKELFDMLLSSGADPAYGLVPAVLYDKEEYLDRCIGLIVETKGFNWGSGLRKTFAGLPEYEKEIDRAVGIAAKRGKSAILNIFIKHGMSPDKVLNWLYVYVTPEDITNSGAKQEFINAFPVRDFLYIPEIHMISLAVICSQKDTVDFLLKHGASPNQYSNVSIYFDQSTAPSGYHYNSYPLSHMGPLQWAALTKNEEILYLLLENGAKSTPTAFTMLHISKISAGTGANSFDLVVIDDPEESSKLQRMRDALEAKSSEQ